MNASSNLNSRRHAKSVLKYAKGEPKVLMDELTKIWAKIPEAL